MLDEYVIAVTENNGPVHILRRVVDDQIRFFSTEQEALEKIQQFNSSIAWRGCTFTVRNSKDIIITPKEVL